MFVVACALALTGLASAPALALTCSQEWEEPGKLDGMSGHPAKQIKRHERPCDGARDRAAYERGRLEGLKTYCTMESGFFAATQDRPYKKVCSSETQAAFLTGYRDGGRLARHISLERMQISVLDNQVMCAGRDLQRLDIELNRLREATVTGEVKLGPVRIGGIERERLERAVQEAEAEMEVVRNRVASLDQSRQETRAVCVEKVRTLAPKVYADYETPCYPERKRFKGLMDKLGGMLDCSSYSDRYN